MTRLQQASDPSHQVLLVYVQHHDGTEPLRSAVRTEAQAVAIEGRNSARPDVRRTSWEEHCVVDHDGSWTAARPIYVVTEGWVAPVALGVYADATDAQAHVTRHGGAFVDVVPMVVDAAGTARP